MLLLTGLPWTTARGEGFKAARRLTHTDVARQDWTTSRAAEAADTMAGMDMGGGDHAATVQAATRSTRSLAMAPPCMKANCLVWPNRSWAS